MLLKADARLGPYAQFVESRRNFLDYLCSPLDYGRSAEGVVHYFKKWQGHPEFQVLLMKDLCDCDCGRCEDECLAALDLMALSEPGLPDAVWQQLETSELSFRHRVDPAKFRAPRFRQWLARRFLASDDWKQGWQAIVEFGLDPLKEPGAHSQWVALAQALRQQWQANSDSDPTRTAKRSKS